MLTDRRLFCVVTALLLAWNYFLFQWFVSHINEIHREIADIQLTLANERSNRLRRDELIGEEASTSSSSFVTRRLGPGDTTPPRATATTLPVARQARTIPPETTTTTTTTTTTKLPPPSPTRSNAVLPIVLFCYNRAEYLRQTLTTLFARRTEPHLHPVVISQDGADAAVAKVANSFPIAKLLQRLDRSLPSDMKFPQFAVYYHISLHYGVGLRQTFDLFPDAPGVIVLEEDISIAPDALSFFRATLPLLLNDTSLMAVSAFNDNGAGPGHEPKVDALHRSDFFPGLGWLMPRRIWNELGPKWADSFWDDWVRNPEQRLGRQFIRPELSRTHTFGERGASGGQFYKEHLEGNSMNELPFDWEAQDLSYFRRRLRQLSGQFDSWRAPLTRSAIVVAIDHANSTVMLFTTRMDSLFALHATCTLMEDEKNGVPRTGYRGVVLFRVEGNVLVLIAHRDTVAKVMA
jgi:alpha-1,3-mannosyl-glycoprotein beta-1,2-N-acetylglucosaminyltransferase